jgi:predicted CXXCH cytochrome family protein
MHASRCFRASAGRMGCISCHDPHVSPAAGQRVNYYRDRCLNCHAERGCSLPLEARRQTSKDDNCVQCHMPTGESDIQHHSITDHRIPRRPGEPVPAEAAPAGDEGLPIRLFHRQLLDAADREAARDLGVALVDRVERYAPPDRRVLGRMALPRLKTALRADPADVPGWDAEAHALWAVGDPDGAAESFDEALTRAPRREITLQWASALALERKKPDAAIAYLERALEVNPWRHEFHYLLAEAQAQRGNWPAAFRACQESLRLNPAGVGPRRLLIEYHLATGQPERARAELDRLLSLHPPDAEALRRWFEQRVR